MILLVGWYEEADPLRRAELLKCLERNAANDRFDHIRVFLEDPAAFLPAHPVFALPKLQTVAHGRRVTFRDLFAHANAHFARRRVVIANADVYFDETLERLADIDLAGRLLCLSRWDVQPDGSSYHFDRADSQDAWVFETPLRAFECDFHLGVPGCDNRLAYEADRAGLVVSNPSRSVRAHHLHLSQIRRYTSAHHLPGPRRMLPAVFLETPGPGPRGPAPEVPLARVAFRETMGYSVARLAPGASSHNNDARPFTALPDALDGLPFTQVVASRAGPVEVTFRTAGKLYVLVGDDWTGSRAATEWLRAVGFREPLPLLQTQQGYGFEVWSLVGEAGERHVIPTQVMLVAGELARAHPVGTARGSREPIFALTSLAPGRERVPRVRECLRSWRAAGLTVRAFNSPDEIAALAALYDVEFVPVAETTASTFGRHYVPVHAMLDWAAEFDRPALLINADIFLRMEPWELNRARLLSAGGLCYFVRHNYTGTLATACPEYHGIDAFLFQGRDVAGFPRSVLSMGLPFWDYWLPHRFAARGRVLRSVEFPAAFHENHAHGWSYDAWRRCAIEFQRVTGAACGDHSDASCHAMSARVRRHLDENRLPIPQYPLALREWLRSTFGGPEPKTFLDLGARPADTEWLARLPNATVLTFEPDGPTAIDFVRGAGSGIKGETLARTRYLFTEYSNATEEEHTMPDALLQMLRAFRVLELWPGAALLANRNVGPAPAGCRS